MDQSIVVMRREIQVLGARLLVGSQGVPSGWLLRESFQSHVLAAGRHVTKGMYLLVPSSSIGGKNPYTMTVTGPESSLRRSPGKPGLYTAHLAEFKGS